MSPELWPARLAWAPGASAVAQHRARVGRKHKESVMDEFWIGVAVAFAATLLALAFALDAGVITR